MLLVVPGQTHYLSCTTTKRNSVSLRTRSAPSAGQFSLRLFTHWHWHTNLIWLTFYRFYCVQFLGYCQCDGCCSTQCVQTAFIVSLSSNKSHRDIPVTSRTCIMCQRPSAATEDNHQHQQSEQQHEQQQHHQRPERVWSIRCDARDRGLPPCHSLGAAAHHVRHQPMKLCARDQPNTQDYMHATSLCSRAGNSRTGVGGRTGSAGGTTTSTRNTSPGGRGSLTTAAGTSRIGKPLARAQATAAAPAAGLCTCSFWCS